MDLKASASPDAQIKCIKGTEEDCLSVSKAPNIPQSTEQMCPDVLT